MLLDQLISFLFVSLASFGLVESSLALGIIRIEPNTITEVLLGLVAVSTVELDDTLEIVEIWCVFVMDGVQ